METLIKDLYYSILNYWNEQKAEEFAACFSENGNVVGFDGSQLNGKEEIHHELEKIFNNHKTARFISIIREVRFLSADVALLRAVVGMVPRDGKDINPDVNAIQSMVAQQKDGKWEIALFQNTPAQFHGRPELVEEMTEELKAALKANPTLKTIS